MTERCCLILTTTNELQVAEKIANALLEQNLVACIQIDDINSYFKWQGKISSEKEYRIMIKAILANYSQIEQLIVSIHHYELPQIIRVDIDGGLPAYLDWVYTSCK